LDDHYLFSGPKGDVDVVSEYRRRRKNKRDAGASDVILFAEKQKVKRLEKRLPPPPRERRNPLAFGRAKHDPELVQRLEGISSQLEIKDPIFHEQWHLFNTVEKGHDVNVTGLWMEGITGHNSTVAMVDDGLDMYSDDLKDNYVSFACSGVGVALSDRANPCVSLRRVLGILTTRVRNPDLDCPTTDTELGVRERLLPPETTCVESEWLTILKSRESGFFRNKYRTRMKQSRSTMLTRRTKFTPAVGVPRTTDDPWKHPVSLSRRPS
jgi:subtilisin family serine protease